MLSYSSCSYVCTGGEGLAWPGCDTTVHCRLKITKRTQLQMWTHGTEVSGFQKAHLQNYSGLGTGRTEVDVASVCHLDTRARRENTVTVCWQSQMDLVYHPSVDAGESIKLMKSTEGHRRLSSVERLRKLWSGSMCQMWQRWAYNILTW